MFNKVFKLILCFAILGFSIQQFIGDNIGNGISLIFLSLTFLLLYFKNEILEVLSLNIFINDLFEKFTYSEWNESSTSMHPVLAFFRDKTRSNFLVSDLN